MKIAIRKTAQFAGNPPPDHGPAVGSTPVGWGANEGGAIMRVYWGLAGHPGIGALFASLKPMFVQAHGLITSGKTVEGAGVVDQLAGKLDALAKDPHLVSGDRSIMAANANYLRQIATGLSARQSRDSRSPATLDPNRAVTDAATKTMYSKGPGMKMAQAVGAAPEATQEPSEGEDAEAYHPNDHYVPGMEKKKASDTMSTLSSIPECGPFVRSMEEFDRAIAAGDGQAAGAAFHKAQLATPMSGVNGLGPALDAALHEASMKMLELNKANKQPKTAAEMWAEGRAERRRTAAAAFTGVGTQALEQSRTARLLWNFSSDRSDGPGVSKANIKEQALRVAKAAVGQYAKHGLRLEFGGIRGHNTRTSSSDLDTGTVMVDGQITTASGVRVPFEMPMQVTGGRLLEPSIIVVHGQPRVVAPSTFRDLIQGNTAYQTRSDRRIYDPPRDVTHERREERRSRGMFASKDAQDALRQALRSGNLDAEFQMKTAEKSEMKDWTGVGNNKDEADVMVDEEVTLSDDIEIVQPGGHTWTYEAGRTARIASIDGNHYKVELDDGSEAFLTRDMFRTAQELELGCDECGNEACECEHVMEADERGGLHDAHESPEASVGSEEDIISKLKELVGGFEQRGLGKADLHKMLESQYPDLAHKFVLIVGGGDQDDSTDTEPSEG